MLLDPSHEGVLALSHLAGVSLREFSSAHEALEGFAMFVWGSGRSSQFGMADVSGGTCGADEGIGVSWCRPRSHGGRGSRLGGWSVDYSRCGVWGAIDQKRAGSFYVAHDVTQLTSVNHYTVNGNNAVSWADALACSRCARGSKVRYKVGDDGGSRAIAIFKAYLGGTPVDVDRAA